MVDSSVEEKIKDTCKSILEGKVDLIEGVHLIVQKAHELPNEKFRVNEYLFVVFISVGSQTDHLPIGKVTSLWNKESLDKKNKEKKEYSVFFKKDIEKACRELIEKFK